MGCVWVYMERDLSGSSTSAVEQVREERRLLFRPYNQSGTNRGRCVVDASRDGTWVSAGLVPVAVWVVSDAVPDGTWVLTGETLG